jgi:hypothetical protein
MFEIKLDNAIWETNISSKEDTLKKIKDGTSPKTKTWIRKRIKNGWIHISTPNYINKEYSFFTPEELYNAVKGGKISSETTIKYSSTPNAGSGGVLNFNDFNWEGKAEATNIAVSESFLNHINTNGVEANLKPVWLVNYGERINGKSGQQTAYYILPNGERTQFTIRDEFLMRLDLNPNITDKDLTKFLNDNFFTDAEIKLIKQKEGNLLGQSQIFSVEDMQTILTKNETLNMAKLNRLNKIYETIKPQGGKNSKRTLIELFEDAIRGPLDELHKFIYDGGTKEGSKITSFDENVKQITVEINGKTKTGFAVKQNVLKENKEDFTTIEGETTYKENAKTRSIAGLSEYRNSFSPYAKDMENVLKQNGFSAKDVSLEVSKKTGTITFKRNSPSAQRLADIESGKIKPTELFSYDYSNLQYDNEEKRFRYVRARFIPGITPAFYDGTVQKGDNPRSEIALSCGPLDNTIRPRVA